MKLQALAPNGARHWTLKGRKAELGFWPVGSEVELETRRILATVYRNRTPRTAPLKQPQHISSLSSEKGQVDCKGT